MTSDDLGLSFRAVLKLSQCDRFGTPTLEWCWAAADLAELIWHDPYCCALALGACKTRLSRAIMSRRIDAARLKASWLPDDARSLSDCA